MVTRKIVVRAISICLAVIVSAIFLPSLANGLVSTDKDTENGPVVDFGDVVKDSSKTMILKITNQTDEPLKLLMTLSYDATCTFLLTGSAVMTVEGQETVDVGVTYEAQSLGPCEGKLYIIYTGTTTSTGTATSGTVIVTLMGNGVDEVEPDNQAGTIVIHGCDTGVFDRDYNGSSLSALIRQCANGARHHGAFARRVARLMSRLKKAGAISGEEKGAIQRCAAQADLHKGQFLRSRGRAKKGHHKPCRP